MNINDLESIVGKIIERFDEMPPEDKSEALIELIAIRDECDLITSTSNAIKTSPVLSVGSDNKLDEKVTLKHNGIKI